MHKYASLPRNSSRPLIAAAPPANPDRRRFNRLVCVGATTSFTAACGSGGDGVGLAAAADAGTDAASTAASESSGLTSGDDPTTMAAGRPRPGSSSSSASSGGTTSGGTTSGNSGSGTGGSTGGSSTDTGAGTSGSTGDGVPARGAPDPTVRRITWTEALDGPANGLANRNWIMPASMSDYSNWPTLRPDYATFPAWTCWDRSDANSVNPTKYAAGEARPNGEVWPVELEAGAVPPVPRQAGTRAFRFYSDAAAQAWHARDLSKAEIHDREPLIAFGWGEEKTLWFGWSEYWTHLDRTGVVTSVQFRNQPYARHLTAQGINVAAEAAARGISTAQLDEYINGSGPCVSLNMYASGGNVYWEAQVRSGTIYTNRPIEWTQPANQRFRYATPVQTGTWYDFVVRYRSSQGSGGHFAIWIRKVTNGVPESAMLAGAPDWQFFGPTEYRYPVVQGIQVRAVPEIRKGIYRWYRRTSVGTVVMPVGTADPNRYTRMFEGPRRMWIGDSDAGLAKVNPAIAY